MLIKLIKAFVLTLLAYLLQTTVAPLIPIASAAPNLALACIAAVSIALGRKYTFLMSAFIGYLMEITLPALNYINMVIYPVAGMLGAIFFADKSERRLEIERASQRIGKVLRGQLNPHIRTILAALISSVLYEGVYLIYIFLNGVAASVSNISKALIAVGYTVLAAAVLQFPIRWFLGIYKRRKIKD